MKTCTCVTFTYVLHFSVSTERYVRNQIFGFYLPLHFFFQDVVNFFSYQSKYIFFFGCFILMYIYLHTFKPSFRVLFIGNVIITIKGDPSLYPKHPHSPFKRKVKYMKI